MLNNMQKLYLFKIFNLLEINKKIINKDKHNKINILLDIYIPK